MSHTCALFRLLLKRYVQIGHVTYICHCFNQKNGCSKPSMDINNIYQNDRNFMLVPMQWSKLRFWSLKVENLKKKHMEIALKLGLPWEESMGSLKQLVRKLAIMTIILHECSHHISKCCKFNAICWCMTSATWNWKFKWTMSSMRLFSLKLEKL